MSAADPAISARHATSRHAQRPAPPQQEAHDERPDQVELLLDRERPHVPQRRRLRELVEVRLPREDEPPVRDVAERGERVGPDAVELTGRREHAGVHHDADHHQEQRGEQPPGAAHPERLQVDASPPRPLGDEQRGDEEAAQHEERVDAEEPADRPRLTGVVEEHGRDREGPDAVERGLVAEAPRRSGPTPRGRRSPARRNSRRVDAAGSADDPSDGRGAS